MKKLFVLGASGFQIHLLVQAKRMGIHTCVVDINPKGRGLIFIRNCKQINIESG
jgi:hypothetical protein